MAKRLSDGVLRGETRVTASEVGREICRNCGGEIVVDASDRRAMSLPHRRVCRKCGAEYGTTAATLYPRREKYGLRRPGVLSGNG
jgi:ribosomal protein L40E